MNEETNNTVSFRLSDKAHKRLVEYAEQAGVTKHQAAKCLLVAALDHELEKQILDCLGRVDDSAAGLRTAMGRGVACILANVTSLTQREIDEWVRSQMLGRQTPPDSPNPADG